MEPCAGRAEHITRIPAAGLAGGGAADHWWPVGSAAGNGLMAGALNDLCSDIERLKQNPQFPPTVRDTKVAYWNKVNSGSVFLDRWAPVQTELFVAGMELSVCRSCREMAVWLGGRMVYP